MSAALKVVVISISHFVCFKVECARVEQSGGTVPKEGKESPVVCKY